MKFDLDEDIIERTGTIVHSVEAQFPIYTISESVDERNMTTLWLTKYDSPTERGLFITAVKYGNKEYYTIQLNKCLPISWMEFQRAKPRAKVEFEKAKKQLMLWVRNKKPPNR